MKNLKEQSSFAKGFVNYKIEALKANADSSYLKAQLAHLRRGVGKPAGSVPEIWGFTLSGIPEQYQSKYGKPSKIEIAVHTTLTLFAMHQQGYDIISSCMYEKEVNIAEALAKFVKSDDDLKRIKRNFDMLATASTISETTYHLRRIIHLLKSESIAFDYAELAEDILRFQFSYAKQSVQLKWGEKFYNQLYRSKKPEEENKNKEKEEES